MWLGSDNYDNHKMAALLEMNSQFPISKYLKENKTKYLSLYDDITYNKLKIYFTYTFLRVVNCDLRTG